MDTQSEFERRITERVEKVESAVLDLDSQSSGNVPVRRRQLERTNVRIRRRNRGRKVSIQSAPIRRLEHQPHHEAFPLQLLPVDVEPSLRLEIRIAGDETAARGSAEVAVRERRNVPAGAPAVRPQPRPGPARQSRPGRPVPSPRRSAADRVAEVAQPRQREQRHDSAVQHRHGAAPLLVRP
mgnify:CR=1 FL=1